MNQIVITLNILGAAALLLWGLHMVSTGVNRMFGAELRHWLNLSADSRPKALLTGLVATLALQSSTATCLMTSSFAARGLLDAASAQAVMLGANVGTSLVVKALTFDLGPLSATLVLVGVALFRSGEGRRRHLGRISIGLGLMLLALNLLDLFSEPLRDAPQMREVLHALDGVPLVGLAVVAVLTAVCHSSVAAILLVLPLATKGDFSLPFGLALVLGANLGSALPPLLETGRDKPAARRVPLGNALARLAGCVLVFPFLDRIAALLPLVEAGRAAQLVDFHVAFNLALAALFLPLGAPLAKLVRRLRPDDAVADDPRRPRYLNEVALERPSVALGAAMRETLRIGDYVEAMLRRTQDALRTGEARKVAEVSHLDDVVDALQREVKLYLARLSNEDLDEDERRRAADIMAFAINLEHIGDIVDRSINALAEKKIRRGLSFSDEGFADITRLFEQTLANLQTAMAVFVSGDVKLARQLVAEKADVRALEREATESHLARIREGRRDSIDTSALHLDLLRDLKRINAHIASVAYPILELRGELDETRLRAVR